jgi:hypothetical protein
MKAFRMASTLDEHTALELTGGLALPLRDPAFRPIATNLLANLPEPRRSEVARRIALLSEPHRSALLASILWTGVEHLRRLAIEAIREMPEFLTMDVWKAVALRSDLRHAAPDLFLSPPGGAPRHHPSKRSPCSACHASIPDGAGYMTIFLALDYEDAFCVTMVLAHVLNGFTDAETIAHADRAQRDKTFERMINGLDLVEIPRGSVHALLRDLFLFMPPGENSPPSLAKVAEVIPLLWRSDAMDVSRGMTPGVLKQGQGRKAGSSAKQCDREAVSWVRELPLMESWVSGAAVEHPAPGGSGDRLEHAFFRLEEDRGLWVANLRGTAVVVAHATGPVSRLAPRFATLADQVAQGIPLRDIPLFGQIAMRTVVGGDIERMRKSLGSIANL